MTISLCPVLMNFSMQITHLNQKWSPVLFVFRCLLLPSSPSNALLFRCSFAAATPSILQSFLSVWSGGRKDAAVRTEQLKKISQIFGIQNDVNPSLCFTKIFRTSGSFSLYLRKWVSPLREQTANPELSVMILFRFLLSFFCSTAHGLTGD